MVGNNIAENGQRLFCVYLNNTECQKFYSILITIGTLPPID